MEREILTPLKSMVVLLLTSLDQEYTQALGLISASQDISLTPDRIQTATPAVALPSIAKHHTKSLSHCHL